MRQIKFRVWDVLEKEMLFPETITPSIVDLQGGILMQFTGLLDKNGKEIYEGDILKRTTGFQDKHPRNPENINSKVVFENGSFKASQQVILSPASIHNKGYEVIGNIYENPELIEPKTPNP